jgi:hypothetical protein
MIPAESLGEGNRMGIDGSGHDDSGSPGNCSQDVRLKFGEAFIRDRRAEAQASPPF